MFVLKLNVIYRKEIYKKKNLVYVVFVLNVWLGDEEFNLIIWYLMLKIFLFVCDLSIVVIFVLRRLG